MMHARFKSSHARLGRAFYLEQAKVCLALSRLGLSREHRAAFIRLALHWRAVARAWDLEIAEAA